MQRNAELCTQTGPQLDAQLPGPLDKLDRQLNFLQLEFERFNPLQKVFEQLDDSTLVLDRGDRHHRHHRRHEVSAADELKKTPPPESSLRNGDIIFQSSSGPDAQLIKKITNSPLTHCGVLFKEGDDWYVYEAVQPVKKTLLKDFAKNGDNGQYAVRRLRDDSVLTDKALTKMHDFLKKNVGKDYDEKFEWTDDRMYCSELVWKAYKEATGRKVGRVKQLGDYDLTDPQVKKALEDRYGKNLPLTEPTIAPGAIFDSKKLKTVR